MRKCSGCDAQFEPKRKDQKYHSTPCRRDHQNQVARRALARTTKARARRLSFEPVVKRCAVRGCRAIFLPAIDATGADAAL